MLTAASVERLRCRAVAGTANNVLSDPSVASTLREHDVLYVPDYVANPGGLIKAAADLEGLDDAAAAARVGEIRERVLRILRTAAAQRTTTLDVADQLARDHLATIH